MLNRIFLFARLKIFATTFFNSFCVMKVFAAYVIVLAGVKLATQVFEVDALPVLNVLPHTKTRKLLAYYLLILNKLFIVR